MRHDNTKPWRDQARQALCSAERLLEAGDPTGATSRAFAAIWNGTRAAIIAQGVPLGPGKKLYYSGVAKAFRTQVLNDADVGHDLVQAIQGVEADRQAGDYGGQALDEKQARDAIATARAVLEHTELVTQTLTRGIEARKAPPDDVLYIHGVRERPMTPEEAEAAYAQVPTARDPDWDLLSTEQFAERAGVSVSTVEEWIHDQAIVAWCRGQRAYVLPAEQLDRAGQPVPQLEDIVPKFGDGYLAWDWLTAPSAALDGKSPLQALAGGSHTKRVVELANAYLDGGFV